jgi:hypothetical protein
MAERWESFKNIAMITANSVQGKVQNMKCADGSTRNENITALKNRAYERM